MIDRDPDALSNYKDCETCQSRTTREQRQFLGCAYEPPPPAEKRLPVVPWTPDGYEGPPPTVCPGYSCKLPEVVEAARLHMHWSKSNLAVALGDAGPLTETMRDAIETVATESSRVERWLIKHPKENG